MLHLLFTRFNIQVLRGGKTKMKIDATEKVLLDRYLKRKKELYPEEISYCEKLIKKIVQEIIKNDLIKKI